MSLAAKEAIGKSESLGDKIMERRKRKESGKFEDFVKF